MTIRFFRGNITGSRLIPFATAVVCLGAATAHADILNVPADYPTIQDAISAATNGDEIVIAPGTYAPFILGGEDLIIRSSDGPVVTIIDAGGVDECVFWIGASGDVTFEGLTFTNGTGTNGGAIGFAFGSPILVFDNCVFSNSSSDNGAVGNPAGSLGRLTFTGCTFSGNSGDVAGGIETVHGDYVFVDCSFLNNTATGVGGGGAISINSTPVSITGCTFEGNSAPRGGAISNSKAFSDPDDQLDDCVFDGNTASGADGGGAIWTSNSIPITSCMFLNNSSPSGPGGGVHATGASGSVAIANSTFDQNDGTDGGGVWLNDGSATDCTFTGNIASGTGGAVHVESGQSTLINCDMSGNMAGVSGGGIYVADLAIANLSDSTLCQNTPDQYDFLGALLASNVSGCDITCPTADPVGACCLPQGGCTVLTEETCLAVGGTYQGDATDCETAGCPTACPGDTNGDGTVGTTDLLALLANWGPCP